MRTLVRDAVLDAERTVTADETPEPAAPPRRAKSRQRVDPPWGFLLSMLALGAILLLAYGASTHWPALIWVEMLLGLAGMSTGGMVGFLFGLPRSHTQDGAEQAGTTATKDGVVRLRYEPSTNLEQISDWLTKLLIGVGLVQLQHVGDALAAIGDMVARSQHPPVESVAVVTQAIFVLSVAIGFIGTFLWTRLYYGVIQTRADQKILDLLRLAVHKAERADTVAESLASGKIGARRDTLTRTDLLSPVVAKGVPAVPASWPQAIRDRIQQFAQAPVVRDSDPAGQIFGEAGRQANGRVLDASVVAEYEDGLIVQLSVRRTARAPLAGDVLFLLHPTFDEPILTATPKDGVAQVEIYTDGWFTVAAIADEGRTVLSFDLRNMPGAPEWFKMD
jgi:hypothetical protein